jgi:hypothetical protein
MIVVKLKPEAPFTDEEIKKLSKEIKGAVKIETKIKNGKQYFLIYIDETKENDN